MRASLPLAEVIERRDVTADLMTVRLRPAVAYTFQPGQYCTIGIDGIERPYSIVSAPEEPYLELLVELVPHGILTPRLWRLGVGDVVSLRPRAKGVFTLDPRFLSHLMVATVTGIAPFVSIIRHFLGRTDYRFRYIVLHGASYQDELIYGHELTEAAARHPEALAYVPTISRPADERNRGWEGRIGRVNLLVEPEFARNVLSPNTTLAYACGHPGMIADVAARLGPRGFAVKEERYWRE